MESKNIDWNPEDVDHLSRHNISCFEVDEIFDGNSLVFRTRNRRYIAIGTTESGRYVTVVFEIIEGRYSIVTARDSDSKEKKLYRKKVRYR